MEDDYQRVAEAVRTACLQAAQAGHERAGLGGLCEEGRWEMALDAIQSLDVGAIIRACTAGAGRPANASGTPRQPGH